ncbi:hypothetical protein QC761_0081900 [Podospora bellae-mahoneyi]|uniref:DUF6594 domain-containing protein n=1 Tax=Podospora bellae-mahoneyi TaxID=2093777 RepID=A0ABR0FES2_9PEZI|nr:hypothetical protein QC761_0081900 [Podospora bellae-mahoneyi]
MVELREKLKGYSTKSLSFPLPRQDANLERQKNSYSKSTKSTPFPPLNLPNSLLSKTGYATSEAAIPSSSPTKPSPGQTPTPRHILCLSAPVKETDPCTTFITEKILRTYRHLLGHRVNTGQAVDTDTGHSLYSPSRISKASSLITTVLASTLPVLAILVLNRLDSTDARTGVTAGLMALFALVIAVFSDAKRIEFFAATTTYVDPVSGIPRVND